MPEDPVGNAAHPACPRAPQDGLSERGMPRRGPRTSCSCGRHPRARPNGSAADCGAAGPARPAAGADAGGGPRPPGRSRPRASTPPPSGSACRTSHRSTRSGRRIASHRRLAPLGLWTSVSTPNESQRRRNGSPRSCRARPPARYVRRSASGRLRRPRAAAETPVAGSTRPAVAVRARARAACPRRSRRSGSTRMLVPRPWHWRWRPLARPSPARQSRFTCWPAVGAHSHQGHPHHEDRRSPPARPWLRLYSWCRTSPQ